MELQPPSRLHTKLRDYALRIGNRKMLLDLPVELRLEIYEWVLHSTTPQTRNALALLRVNRQVHSEILCIAFPLIRFRFSRWKRFERFMRDVPTNRHEIIEHVKLIATTLDDLVTLPLKVDGCYPSLQLKSLTLVCTSSEPLHAHDPDTVQVYKLREGFDHCLNNMRTDQLNIINMAYSADPHTRSRFTGNLVCAIREAWLPTYAEHEWDYEFGVVLHEGFKRLVIHVGKRGRAPIHHERVSLPGTATWGVFETLVFGRREQV